MPILKLRNDFLKNIDYTDEFLRKRKERQRRIRKRRLIAWFIFFIIVSLTVGVILSLTVLFPIKKLQVSGSKIYSPEQITDVSGIDLGDNLFTVSSKDTLNNLRAKLPFIETVKFKRILPDTLKVSVSDAEKYACYKSGDKYYTVSAEGWVLEETSEPSENVFLIISKAAELTVGKAVRYKNENEKQKTEQIIEYLNAQKISIDYIDVSDDINLKAGVEGRFIAEFGTDSYLEAKIKHLKSMIETIEEGKSGRIVLSMWNPQNRQCTFVQNNTN